MHQQVQNQLLLQTQSKSSLAKHTNLNSNQTQVKHVNLTLEMNQTKTIIVINTKPNTDSRQGAVLYSIYEF